VILGKIAGVGVNLIDGSLVYLRVLLEFKNNNRVASKNYYVWASPSFKR
jgi:hypothetical protein